MSHRTLIMVASAAAFLWGPVAQAQSVAAFYAGKTVRIVIGTNAGGDYGTYAQLIANHIGKHVPGRPTVIVQPMPGGGGMTALSYIAKIAPQDGSVLSMPHLNIVQDGLLSSRVQFDPGKFQWIGRIRDQVQVGVASAKSNARSIEDAKTKVLVAGGVGANNPSALNPRIVNVLVGTKFKIVSGYKNTSEVAIAWERGEVDVFTNSWDIIAARVADQLKAGLVHPLYVYALKRPADLRDIPLINEFGRNDAEKAFLEIYSIGTEIGRSLAAPPGMPMDRLDAWRAAFMTMLEDSEFRAAVSKGNLRLDPLAGQQLASMVANVVSLPPDTVAKAREFYDRLLAEVK
jgi:tripartite-type tricarboxylate transporter receptor subunit TctC